MVGKGVANITTARVREESLRVAFSLPSEYIVQQEYKPFIHVLSSMRLKPHSSFTVLGSTGKEDEGSRLLSDGVRNIERI